MILKIHGDFRSFYDVKRMPYVQTMSIPSSVCPSVCPSPNVSDYTVNKMDVRGIYGKLSNKNKFLKVDSTAVLFYSRALQQFR